MTEGPGWAFRLVGREPWGLVMQALVDDSWRDSYSFDLGCSILADIVVANHFTSTSPASPFVTSRIASLPLADGRVSRANHTLTRMSSSAPVDPPARCGPVRSSRRGPAAEGDNDMGNLTTCL